MHPCGARADVAARGNLRRSLPQQPACIVRRFAAITCRRRDDREIGLVRKPG
jgi:hypothetical protein